MNLAGEHDVVDYCHCCFAGVLSLTDYFWSRESENQTKYNFKLSCEKAPWDSYFHPAFDVEKIVFFLVFHLVIWSFIDMQINRATLPQ